MASTSIDQPPEMGQILCALARRQHDRVVRDAVLVEAPAQRREVMARDLLVGDDYRLPSPQQRQHRGAGASRSVRGRRQCRSFAPQARRAAARLRPDLALSWLSLHIGGPQHGRTVRERGDDARRRLFRRAVAAVDDDIGLGIDRMAPLDQLREHRSRIAALQQRPVVAAGHPRDQYVEIGAQPYRDPAPCDRARGSPGP